MKKSTSKHDFAFASCVYSGILNRIDFEIKYGVDDKTEELQYCVDKYCEEYVISGNYLREKLEEYKQAVKNR